MPPLQELDAVLPLQSGLARKVLDYTGAMKALVDAAKQPDFDSGRWNEIERFVDVQAFERIGNFKEIMDWTAYRAFLDNWARSADWECSFRRVTEQAGLVFLELEERSLAGGHRSVVNSVSVYEFDDAGLIRHLDIYLQMPLPDPALLASYAGVDIAG